MGADERKALLLLLVNDDALLIKNDILYDDSRQSDYLISVLTGEGYTPLYAMDDATLFEEFTSRNILGVKRTEGLLRSKLPGVLCEVYSAASPFLWIKDDALFERLSSLSAEPSSQP